MVRRRSQSHHSCALGAPQVTNSSKSCTNRVSGELAAHARLYMHMLSSRDCASLCDSICSGLVHSPSAPRRALTGGRTSLVSRLANEQPSYTRLVFWRASYEPRILYEPYTSLDLIPHKEIRGSYTRLVRGSYWPKARIRGVARLRAVHVYEARTSSSAGPTASDSCLCALSSFLVPI